MNRILLLLLFIVPATLFAQKIEFRINGTEMGHIDSTRFSFGDPGANIFIGEFAGQAGLSGFGNIAIGASAGRVLGSGTLNTIIGRSAGFNFTNGHSNTLVGAFAGYNISSGEGNVFLGRLSGFNNTIGNSNVAVGRGTMRTNSAGDENVAIGDSSLELTSGNGNVGIGAHAGKNNNSGAGNIFIGYKAGMNETGSERLYIHNSGTAMPLIYGEFDNDILGFNADVGIGTQLPANKLHVMGGTRLDSGNPALQFYNGTTSLAYLQHNATTLFIRNVQNGPIYLGTDNSTDITIQTGGNVGIGTINPAEKLHVINSARIDGGNPALRFYNGSLSRAYIQHNHPAMFMYNVSNGPLHLGTNSTARMTISALGSVGIGTLTPGAKLHVNNGAITIEDTSPVMFLSSSGLVKSTLQYISSIGALRLTNLDPSGDLEFRTNNTAQMTIGADGNVGVGTAPVTNYKVDVDSDRARGLNISNGYVGSLHKYGVYATVDALGSGLRSALYGSAIAPPSTNETTRGVSGIANGNGGPSTLYGVYGSVTSSGSGTKYGLYGLAPVATNSWALWANGNAHFEDDVRIGHTDDVAGYRLSVDGKVIAEELKVQLSQNWPDYVFDPAYELPPLTQLKDQVQHLGHLPGIPSASEVTEAGGIHVGEMNRLLLEKVEELTLYVISLQEQIDTLKARQ